MIPIAVDATPDLKNAYWGSKGSLEFIPVSRLVLLVRLKETVKAEGYEL